MQLDDRLTHHYRREGAILADRDPSPGDLGSVKMRARRRTRNRRVATSLAGLVLVGGATATALRLLDQDSSLTIETLGIDEQSEALGLPPSTGPVLTWTDLGTAAFEARSATWTGEWFVAFGNRIPNTGVGDPSIGGIYRSADGEMWDLVTEPVDNKQFVNVQLWSDGTGTVLAWSNSHSNEAVTRVLRSDDHGRTFTDLGTFPIFAPPDGPVTDMAEAVGMGIVDDAVYAAVAHSAQLDVAALLEAAGEADLAEGYRTGEFGLGYGFSPDGLSICLDDNCDDTELFPIEDMDLTPDVRARLRSEMDGGPIELVRLTPGEPPTSLGQWDGRSLGGLMVAPEGAPGPLRLAVAVAVPDRLDTDGPAHTRLITSTDGTSWIVTDLSIDTVAVWFDDDGALIASYEDGGAQLSRSIDGGMSWSPVATAAGHGFVDGPAGEVVVGNTGAAVTEWPGYVVARGDYRLEVTDGVAVLYDTTTEEVLGRVDTSADVDVSDWLIEREPQTEDEAWTLTVLHPGTGEELMVITEADLDALGALHDDGVDELPMLGWSADGETWGWQTYGQAFGTDIEADHRRGNEPIRFVVGSDRVLAVVPPLGLDETPASEATSAPLSRVYAADVTG
jgi:hypothetical protein